MVATAPGVKRGSGLIGASASAGGATASASATAAESALSIARLKLVYRSAVLMGKYVGDTRSESMPMTNPTDDEKFRRGLTFAAQARRRPEQFDYMPGHEVEPLYALPTPWLLRIWRTIMWHLIPSLVVVTAAASLCSATFSFLAWEDAQRALSEASHAASFGGGRLCKWTCHHKLHRPALTRLLLFFGAFHQLVVVGSKF